MRAFASFSAFATLASFSLATPTYVTAERATTFETVLNLVKLEAFLPLTFPILNLTMMYQISVWRIGLDWTMVRVRFA